MSAFINITGNVYGQLTVLKEVQPRHQPIKWLCQCTCGNTTEVVGFSIKSGLTKSCGCLRVATSTILSTTHGDTGSRLYNIFNGIHQRCNNHSDHHYAIYGGKGIKVCTEWQKYEDFKTWALANGYKSTLSIEREDGNKDYSPDNCCWANTERQARNRQAQVGKTSQYIGVHWNKKNKNWVASIGIGKNTQHIGSFANELMAASARDSYITAHNLKYFVLNFP